VYNAGTDPQLKDAAVLLSEVVLPELDRRFDKFVEPVTAEIEDRTGIQRRAVERHRDAKTANLREQQDRNRSRAELAELAGDQRRARQLISVNTAIEGKLRKLRDACERRLQEIEAQRELVPEWEDLAGVFVEVIP
jgi:SMC interacting uncharacterized protein involved in chromosome segregation